jgi:3-isopropylmalate/(R)-2-methylmalate dehydratase small subunit
MNKFDTLISTVAVLDRDDIDTDQIIPARFLRTTERTGLGKHLFSDWRSGPEGQPRKDFVLNQKDNPGRSILLAGRNFGCGSSREHAVWALLDFGFRAIIAQGFADIFRKNALRNGLLTISVDEETHAKCLAAANRGTRFQVDLEGTEVTAGDFRFGFRIDPFARLCMLGGVDELEFVLGHGEAIAAFEAAHGAG